MSKKGLLSLLFVVIVSVGLVACEIDGEPEKVNNNDSVNTSANVNNNNENDEEEVYVVGDTVKLGDHKLKVTNVEKSAGDDFDKPKEGKEYVVVTVEIENDGDENISYNMLYFSMSNSQGQIDSASFSIIDTDTNLGSGDLAPGGSTSGTVVFEQPVDDDDLKLIYEPNMFSSKNITIELN